MRINNSKGKTGGKRPTGPVAGGAPKGTFKNPTLSSSPGGPAKKPTTGGKRPTKPKQPTQLMKSTVMPVKPKGGTVEIKATPKKGKNNQMSAAQLKDIQRQLQKANRKATRKATRRKARGLPVGGRGAGASRRPSKALRGATMARSGTGTTASRRPAARPIPGSPAAKRQAMQRRGRQAVQRVRSRVGRPARPTARSRRPMRGR